jgi:hypothetical protein
MKKLLVSVLVIVAVQFNAQTIAKGDLIAGIGLGASSYSYIIYEINPEPYKSDPVQSMTLPASMEYCFSKWLGVSANYVMSEQEIFTTKEYRATTYDFGLQARLHLPFDSIPVDISLFGGAGMNVFRIKGSDYFFGNYRERGQGFAFSTGITSRFFFNRKFHSGVSLTLLAQRCPHQNVDFLVADPDLSFSFYQNYYCGAVFIGYFYNIHMLRN